jgi:protein-export membrane protein SecD
MRLALPPLGLVLCILASPATALGAHMVLKVDLTGVRDDLRREVMVQCMEVASHRLDGLGIKSAKVAIEGLDRVVADIPNISDLGKIREMFDAAQPSLSFRPVDEDTKDDDLRAGRVPEGVEILDQRPTQSAPHPSLLAVYRDGGVSGERIADAQLGYDQRTGEPMVAIQFDSLGKRQFTKFTEDNVGKRFAIVLNGKIVSAPHLVEPISGGSGEITGSFTEKEASALAMALQIGLTPAPWTVVELEKTP